MSDTKQPEQPEPHTVEEFLEKFKELFQHKLT